MVLQTIYVVRHGYRSNWTVDPLTGEYAANVPSPTGIASDPALASYGVKQAEQLGRHLATLDPPVDLIYSSPFYRCLQTLSPFVESRAAAAAAATTQSSPDTPGVLVNVEPGLGEFYGLARFDHPSPAPLAELRRHFAHLPAQDAAALPPVVVPSTRGESITRLHDRVAYALHRLVARADADPARPAALLICTHAAVMIAIGRALTGRMPASETEDDFQCFTCSLSKFVRRGGGADAGEAAAEEERTWVAEKPEEVPDVGWKDGKGVAGGWECEVNGDCSFLAGGEERGWSFAMEVQQAGK